MRAKVERVRGLLARYRIDRRLPPQVLLLFRSRLRLKIRRGLDRLGAVARPVLGTGGGATDGIVRVGARRAHSAGPLRVPVAALMHEFAGHAVDVLSAAGLDPFVVEHRGHSLRFGLPLEQRDAALDALAASGGPGWYLDWEDGPVSGTVPLERAADRAAVRRARRWSVYRIDGMGEIGVGRDQGAEFTFWTMGTSGQLELVGTRGHERFDRRSAHTKECIDDHVYPGRSAFPVEASLERFVGPIDIVFTWVDGADPAWRERFDAAARAAGMVVTSDATDEARFRSRDELRYALRAVWAFCGWFRNIYVVTADQTPPWLGRHDRVRVVSHSEILPASALPTFNSHAIESALHRIEGLAEHFVYFNDDVFVARPLRPEAFFTPNGLSKTFPSGARVPGYEDEGTIATDTAARRGRELLLERFGRTVTSKPLHAPYPLRRSVMEEVAVEFAEAVDATAHRRFRSPQDISVAASFAQHYAVATERGVFGNLTAEYVHVESGRLDVHLEHLLLERDIDAFCVNETSSVGGVTEARERRLRSFFDEYFPVPAPWERHGGEP